MIDILMVAVLVIIDLMIVTEVNENPIAKSKPKAVRRRVANIMALVHLILRKSVIKTQQI